MKIPRFISEVSTKAMSWLSQYSLQQESIVGVDICPHSLRVAELSKKGSQWEVEKLGSRTLELPEGVKALEDDTEFFSNELKILLRESGIETRNLAIPLPVSNAIIKVVSVPLMSNEELETAIGTESLWENVVQLTDALTDYSIFYQVLSRHTNLNTMDLLFVASRLADIQTVLDIVQLVDLKPMVLDVRCFTLKNAVDTILESKSKATPIAILEMGEIENYIVILKDNSPYIAEIFVRPQDLQVLSGGESDPQIMKSTLDRFGLQITQVLAAFESKHHGQVPEVLYVVSELLKNEVVLSGVQERLQKVRLEPFDPFQKLTVNDEQVVQKIDETENVSLYATAVGLATRKLDIFGYFQYVVGTNNINLLPNRENLRLEGRASLIGGFVLMFAVLFLLTFGSYQLINYWGDSEENNEVLADYEVTLSSLDSQKRIKAKLNSRQMILADPFKGYVTNPLETNQQWSFDVLQEITLSVPADIELRQVSYDGAKAMILKGVTGKPQAVHDFAIALQESATIESAQVGAVTDGSGNSKRFSVNLELHGPERGEMLNP